MDLHVSLSPVCGELSLLLSCSVDATRLDWFSAISRSSLTSAPLFWTPSGTCSTAPHHAQNQKKKIAVLCCTEPLFSILTSNHPYLLIDCRARTEIDPFQAGNSQHKFKVKNKGIKIVKILYFSYFQECGYRKYTCWTLYIHIIYMVTHDFCATSDLFSCGKSIWGFYSSIIFYCSFSKCISF